ncbi:site-specific integrase [Dermacoccus sp. PAMC28757]|uniref:tyrosine-type recombinase/integrase n=1 Tax=Dermacoccus sp. PAMC28757 TaxID=2762331 RepID=UPI00164EBE29|nr:site-specific integrase [Dermacoccus sp. PAMC28757]QNK52493.1 site-specific integrase [Dermacoccus sp. PAMC28757]
MGRERMEPGQVGEVQTGRVRYDDATRSYKTATSAREADAWRARVRVRLWNGKSADLRAVASTQRKAEASVREKVRAALSTGEARISSSTPIVKACEMWLEDRAAQLSPQTLKDYRGALSRVIAAPDSPVLALTVGQANDAQVLRRLLWRATEERGRGAAKHARAVIGGTLKQAAADGVVAASAVPMVGALPKAEPRGRTERDTRRAFTETELADLLALADARVVALGLPLAEDAEKPKGRPPTVAKRQAVADLVHLLAHTGMRIGEARALRWADLDLTTRTLRVEGTKTDAARRTIALSPGLAARLTERAQREGMRGLVFPAPTAGDPEKPWEQKQVATALRDLLDDAGHDWATPHTFRRTLITTLSAMNVPLRQVSDWVGHKDSAITASAYLGRSFDSDKTGIADLIAD